MIEARQAEPNHSNTYKDIFTKKATARSRQFLNRHGEVQSCKYSLDDISVSRSAPQHVQPRRGHDRIKGRPRGGQTQMGQPQMFGLTLQSGQPSHFPQQSMQHTQLN